MSEPGYYRFPTIHADAVVFVSEDDLWTVPAGGGVARRLTSGLGAATHPALSPDGRWLAFSGREEGPAEVYLMPAEGGQPRRFTYAGIECVVVGWTPDGRVIYASMYGQPFMGLRRLFAVAPEGDAAPEMLPVGPALYLSFAPGAAGGNGDGRPPGRVLARPSVDPAHWKRYRGGTAGDLWVDPAGDGDWRRLIKLEGNPSRPLWVADRIYFISDHEGVGNLYSCTAGGKDLRRHSDHDDYYARHAASDGRRIVYHAGADLYLFDSEAGDDAGPSKIRVDYHSPRTQRNRKFIDAAHFLESYAPHPQGHVLCLTTRGKVATLGNWEGSVRHHGDPCAGRYRLATWLSDGKRLVALSDDEGNETLTVHDAEGVEPCVRLDGLDLSRVVHMKASPTGDHVALSNIRNELILVDVAKKAARVLDRSGRAPIMGFDFSPDGKWVAYAWSESIHTSIIKLCRLEDGATFPVTRTVLQDVGPAFDPEGKYLYFLSRREFDPVYDNLHFDLGFPKGMRPYLVTLRKDLPSPFMLSPKPLEEEKKEESKKGASEAEGGGNQKPQAAVTIDLEGIEDRVLPFPVPEGIYQQIEGIKGKVLFTSVPVEGSLKKSWIPGSEPPAKATLEAFDFEKGKAEALVKDITDFALSADRKTLVYRAGNKLRAVKAGEKPDEEAAKKPAGRESGWVDLKRPRVQVEPPAEWRQMYGEAWRLQREQFWVEDMADVDWPEVYQRYLPLLDRVSTRTEFSDLLWEMQGELGSSHAYSIGGDAREDPKIDMGFLGADLAWDESAGGWRVEHIVRGDVWDAENAPPLLRPGANVREGGVLLAVNGRRTSAAVSPAQLLVNQGGMEVALTVADPAGSNGAPAGAPRVVTVKALKNETPLRYREWVERNREGVHRETGGRCGYVHVPNMGPVGYAEFHRAFLAEVDRDGLLIDVRFNGGGHVSALLLEKLARKRMAYMQSRWFGVHPWPDDAPPAPMVALTNEYAGSDGDIFSHNFKAMNLGPLIGKRTWGGVIGIWPRHTLVDGGVTTQPEFSFWFRDIGWKVENYGVDPDIEVEFRPQDYAAGEDPQLRRGVEELVKILEGAPPKVEFDPRPSRAWRRERPKEDRPLVSG